MTRYSLFESNDPQNEQYYGICKNNEFLFGQLERPVYDTCKETKIIRFDLCWGFRVFHVRLEEEDTVMNSL